MTFAPPTHQPKPTPTQAVVLQRKCACGGKSGMDGKCDECRKKKRERSLQRSAMTSGDVGEVPSIVHDVIGSAGTALDSGTRSFMESRFGRDFSNVRIHTDAKAAASADAVNARA